MRPLYQDVPTNMYSYVRITLPNARPLIMISPTSSIDNPSPRRQGVTSRRLCGLPQQDQRQISQRHNFAYQAATTAPRPLAWALSQSRNHPRGEPFCPLDCAAGGASTPVGSALCAVMDVVIGRLWLCSGITETPCSRCSRVGYHLGRRQLSKVSLSVVVVSIDSNPMATNPT